MPSTAGHPRMGSALGIHTIVSKTPFMRAMSKSDHTTREARITRSRATRSTTSRDLPRQARPPSLSTIEADDGGTGGDGRYAAVRHQYSLHLRDDAGLLANDDPPPLSFRSASKLTVWSSCCCSMLCPRRSCRLLLDWVTVRPT